MITDYAQNLHEYFDQLNDTLAAANWVINPSHGAQWWYTKVLSTAAVLSP